MSMGAAQMQRQLYSDLQIILGEDYKVIKGNLADPIPLDKPAPFIIEGEVPTTGEEGSRGETSKDKSIDQQ